MEVSQQLGLLRLQNCLAALLGLDGQLVAGEQRLGLLETRLAAGKLRGQLFVFGDGLLQLLFGSRLRLE